jgi:spore coat protein U-like protein
MKHILSRILIAMGLALFAGEALAQQNVTINATVAKSCAVSYSGTSFSLLNVDSAAGATAAPIDVTITCNNGTRYQYQFTDGVNASATSRRLSAVDSVPTSFFWNFDFQSSTDGGTSYVTAPLAMPVTAGIRSTGRNTPQHLLLRVAIPGAQDPNTNVVTDYTETIAVTVAAEP